LTLVQRALSERINGAGKETRLPIESLMSNKTPTCLMTLWFNVMAKWSDDSWQN